jgi:hypothetical protein
MNEIAFIVDNTFTLPKYYTYINDTRSIRLEIYVEK